MEVSYPQALDVFLARTRDRQISKTKAMTLENDDCTTSKGCVDGRQGPEDQCQLIISPSQ
jgi:hypothetical protein